LIDTATVFFMFNTVKLLYSKESIVKNLYINKHDMTLLECRVLRREYI